MRIIERMSQPTYIIEALDPEDIYLLFEALALYPKVHELGPELNDRRENLKAHLWQFYPSRERG